MTDTSSSKSTYRSRVQTELFRPSLQYPPYPYAEMLARTAERFPENEAVIFSAPIRLANPSLRSGQAPFASASGFAQARRKERDVNLTYRELDALVNSFANALLDLGIHKGERVCLLMMNRPEFLVSW